MSDLAIQMTDVVKTFGRFRALDGLNLAVPTGQVHGFLGPNGAGKSTTIRVLLGLLRPDSGSARLLGGDAYADAAALHRRLAYVPGDVNLWPQLTGGEVIDLLTRARGSLDERRREQLIQRFDLDPTKKCKTYSKGNRQKVALIAALASDVELLLLDEPTSGLDPLMERTFADVVHERTDQGVTVLLSSHILSEVEALCSHVSIIKQGRIVDSGTLDDLRKLHRTHVRARLARAVPEDLMRLDGVHDLRVQADHWSADVDEAVLPTVISQLAAVGVTGLVSAPPSLEELFLQHYSDDPQPATS